MKHKILVLAVTVFIVVLVSGMALLDNLGLAFFNFAFGKQVYVVKIDYSIQPNMLQDQVTSAYISVSLSLLREQVPIETVLSGFKVTEGQASFSQAFTIYLELSVTVANNVNVYWRSFSFNDAKSRTIRAYLNGFSSDQYSVLNVRAKGLYELNGIQTTLDYGNQFQVTNT